MEGVQSSPVIAGADEVVEVASELVVVVVVETFDGRLLDGAVHAFDLAIRPRVLGFGCAVLDAEGGAGIFEGMRPDGFALCEGFGNQLCCRSASTRRGEMGAVIGQHDADPVRHGFNKVLEKVGGGSAQGLAMKFDEGEFACPINGNEEIEPAFRRLHLGNVPSRGLKPNHCRATDVEKADGIALELLFGGPITFDIRKPRYPMALKATVQG